jgi:phage-related protein
VHKRPKKKPIDWLGASLDDLKSFPDEVQQAIGFELYQAELGEMPASAKPLKGDLSGTYELRERYEGNAYRAVYIAKLAEKIYVLHCFQKKSKSGIATPPKDIELIKRRLKEALADNIKITGSTSHRKGKK